MQTDKFSILEGTPFVHVTRTMNRSIKDVFDCMIDADISYLFPRKGDVAGIISATVPTKDWKLGQERVMTFDDGTSVGETLLTYEPYHFVSYRATHFTSPIQKQLLKSMEAAWSFTDNGNNTTNVEVSYGLVPANPEAKLVIEQSLLKHVRSRMETLLSIVNDDLEV